MKRASLLVPLLFFLSAGLVFSQNFGQTTNGELTLKALQKCFPDKTGEVSFIDGDWTIRAGDETFFWAEGRLLPEADRDKADSYSPHFFMVYPEKPPSPHTYPPQYIEILRSRGSAEMRREVKDNHRAFQGILYGGLDRREVETHLERIDFLDKKINIHRDVAATLRRVDAEIRRWDGAEAFIASVENIGGYNWREIAETQRMSYHSWGLAVDIQPKGQRGKAIYWQWERRRNANWMLVPLEGRWNPPQPVIEAFEREGFIWGGKWPFYDNMHFEYRPELHELSRLLAANPERSASGYGRDLHHISPDFFVK